MSDIRDGTSYTIMLGELIAGISDTFPGGADRGDLRGTWAHVWMGMASYTHLYTPNTSAGDGLRTEWCKDMPEAGLPCNDPQAGPGGTNYASARSHHPGGVNVVFVDGHVQMYSDSVDLSAWKAMATHAQGEIIGQF